MNGELFWMYGYQRVLAIRLAVVIILLLATACSKGEGLQGEDTPGRPAGPEQEQVVRVEKLYIELNGQTYCAFAGGEGVLLEQQEQDEPQEQDATTLTGRQDTIRLQEEGLRSLKFIGYEPADATPPLIDSIEFHHDIYTYSQAADSITIMGGSYALPDNWYLSPVGKGLLALKGEKVAETAEVSFYNYSNNSYDSAIIEVDGNPVSVTWAELGKPRRFRILLTLGQEGRNRFEIPFYENPNTVKILPPMLQPLNMEGVPQGIKFSQKQLFSSGKQPTQQKIVIIVSPGDTLQMRYSADAPGEFNVFEWCMGTATKRYKTLNATEVEVDFFSEIADPLLTEEGMRYTLSKVHLSRDGVLAVDADWDPGKAKSSGGGVFNELPVCVIGMPAGNPLVEAMARTFTFPTGECRSFPPTPFYCNATVLIAE